MSNKEVTTEGTVHTCAHDVSYYYKGEGQDLTDEEKEQLKDAAETRAHDCIAESGCVEGELCECVGENHEREFRGWWSIIKD